MTARRRLLSRALSFSFLFAAFASIAAAGIAPYAWQEKVDPVVLTHASGSTEFIVFLSEQADLKGAEALPTRLEKGQYVFQTLSETARKTQQPVLDSLASLGAEYRPYWIANMIWVRGDAAVVQAMAERDDVAHVYANPLVPMAGPVRGDEPADVSTPSAIEWGVLKIRADLVWSAGFDGLGVVIGGQDTGYDWTHTAIKDQYRGWNGTSANHNYNWHDSIHSGGGVCGADATAPCDDHNHGTHTMGTMVGDDGGANQIGVAPGARWIGCRNMDQGNGTPTTYSECFQWFLAPTDVAGLNPDPSKAPDVINNSWSCPPSEGCTDPNVMKTVVDNTRAAGIVVVVSAGNGGSACSSVADPAAIYDSSFSIGATNSTDVIASFSSRGPVTADGSNRLKPNVSAPGVSVRSSIRNGGYASYSGTSMAGPHTAGAVALLIDAQPSLGGQVGSIETILETTAIPRTTTQACGGVSGSTIPNNTYGFGRIDAYGALLSISANLGVTIAESADPVQTGTNLTWTITVTNGGPAIAAATTVTDTLPSGATYVSATPSTGSCSQASGTITCNLGDMAAGTATIDVVVSFTAEGSYTNTVTTSSPTLDLASANNSAQISTSVCAVPPTPSITTPLSVASGSSGNTASIPATGGHTYAWSLTGGGSINGASTTSSISFTAGSPATIMTFGVTESSLSCTSALATRRVFVDFLDVPIGSTFHDFVVTIAMNNITLGCTGTNYCPEGFVPRRTMAAFMARAMAGNDASVPPSGTIGASAFSCTPSGGTSLFSDVSASDPFCRHIHYIAAQNVTLGCRSGAFCPSDNVPRDQMAAFVSRAIAGSDAAVPFAYTDVSTGRSYDIPNGNVHFTDMPGSAFSRYAHYLWATGKIDGCTGTTYCPTTLVTRRQMAKFLTNGFDLTAP